jgi:hypothetical protein
MTKIIIYYTKQNTDGWRQQQNRVFFDRRYLIGVVFWERLTRTVPTALYFASYDASTKLFVGGFIQALKVVL